MNLSKLNKKELSNLATEKKIKNRSKMSKDELIKALEPFYFTTNTKDLASSQVGYDNANNPPKKEVIKRDEYPIPPYYNKDMISLMPVDPSREYVYWEISDYTLANVKAKYNLDVNAKLTLKVFSTPDNKTVEQASVLVERIGCWYFNLHLPDVTVWAEIGVVDKNGVFHSILKSQIVKMPADKVSDIIDEETWMTIGGDLDKLYKLSGVGMRDANSSISIHEEVIKQLQIHTGSSNMSFTKE